MLTFILATLALISTSQGDIEVELFPDAAPKAVENFTKLAENHYYEGTTFHRVIPGFMIQGGDPAGNGTGGKSIWGKPFEDEVNDKLKFNKPGLLAMANAGPNTNGSQFFITVAPAPWLNKKHTIFGKVIRGQEVVNKIVGVPTTYGNKPIEPQKILKIQIKAGSD